MAERETMQEKLSACISSELITACPCLCYTLTEKGQRILKSYDIKKDIEHILDSQLGYIFSEPYRRIEQDTFIANFKEALDEKAEKDVRGKIYNLISLISDRELMSFGASELFVFTCALDIARNLGYVRHRGEVRLELMGPERFFKVERGLAGVVK